MGVILGAIIGFVIGFYWLNAPNLCAVAGVMVGYLYHAKLYNVSRAVNRIASALHLESRSSDEDENASGGGSKDDPGAFNTPAERDVSGFYTPPEPPSGGGGSNTPGAPPPSVGGGGSGRWFL